MSTESFLSDPRLTRFLPPLYELKEPTHAFTHTSFHGITHEVFESKDGIANADYERLEFVGDAFLGFVVAELICENHPTLTVGTATLLRSKLVNNSDSLARLSVFYKIPSRLQAASAQEELLRNTTSVQADIFESYLEALRKEVGFDIARNFVRSVFEPLIDYIVTVMREDQEIIIKEENQVKQNKQVSKLGGKSAISFLEEWKMKGTRRTVEFYFPPSSGTSHNPHFTATCTITFSEATRIGVESKKQLTGFGEGATKKLAKERCAEDLVVNNSLV